jgi:Raf kinase inhibitor-like YbhB/YbcL family protein
MDKVASFSVLAALPETITLESPMFGNGEFMPSRFTADGVGTSPPLEWAAPPNGIASLILLVEDADAPSPKPLVHCIVVGLPPESRGIPEGALNAAPDRTHRLGKNSFLKSEWLPPDPPPGHGIHRYVFQLFALAEAPDFNHEAPGRGEIVELIRGHGVGRGTLIGTYKRS